MTHTPPLPPKANHGLSLSQTRKDLSQSQLLKPKQTGYKPVDSVVTVLTTSLKLQHSSKMLKCSNIKPNFPVGWLFELQLAICQKSWLQLVLYDQESNKRKSDYLKSGKAANHHIQEAAIVFHVRLAKFLNHLSELIYFPVWKLLGILHKCLLHMHLHIL